MIEKLDEWLSCRGPLRPWIAPRRSNLLTFAMTLNFDAERYSSASFRAVACLHCWRKCPLTVRLTSYAIRD